jgi:ADP-L-glycero-D-manno-heptose 6-epimerase
MDSKLATALKSKKIIVTGANGFIGSVVVWELNQRGFTDIIAVDTVPLSERNLLKDLEYSQFLSRDELWPYLANQKPGDVSWIVHMGACSSTTEKNWDFLLE